MGGGVAGDEDDKGRSGAGRVARPRLGQIDVPPVGGGVVWGEHGDEGEATEAGARHAMESQVVLEQVSPKYWFFI